MAVLLAMDYLVLTQSCSCLLAHSCLLTHSLTHSLMLTLTHADTHSHLLTHRLCPKYIRARFQKRAKQQPVPVSSVTRGFLTTNEYIRW